MCHRSVPTTLLAEEEFRQCEILLRTSIQVPVQHIFMQSSMRFQAVIVNRQILWDQLTEFQTADTTGEMDSITGGEHILQSQPLLGQFQHVPPSIGGLS